MQFIDYITECVYAGAGALLGYLLMKIDDVLNNKQYTTKEYSKFTLGCYLATLTGLLLMRAAGPIKIPSTEPVNIIRQPAINLQNTSTPSQIHKPATIPSSGTAFFQPANNLQALRFAAGTPTF